MQKIIFAILLTSLTFTSCIAYSKESLHIIAWPGYADDDVVSEFSKRFNADVTVRIIGSDDELWETIHSPDIKADVFAVNTAELQRYIEENLTTPINSEDLPNQKFQQKQFQPLSKVHGLINNNHLYAIPYAYSEMGLIYNKDIVKQAPTSMNVMWDSTYKGQVLSYNGSTQNFSMAALALGIKNPFQLNQTQFGNVTKRIAALRKNTVSYYNMPEEVVETYKRKPVALVYANYGTQQVKMLRDAGANIGYIIPKEGALAWLDCWAIPSKSENKKLAHEWINFSLRKPVSDLLSSRYGLSNTITTTPNTPKGKLIWLEPVENATMRTQIWERIIGGYRKGVQ
ncbi:extracellular solute-binding protein [Leeia sp. TBRC 13508]|uniref:Extracellular solute-binding protein n=1 Tax=Leeia speluncae TaxID=2884804 RepID=A0ABS8D6R3_9NEIS|nr:extracellular solute-binding protein [Leeia speluncae]MCB6183862.1 extracellular solute-binding protein [Leeia speluncae]